MIDVTQAQDIGTPFDSYQAFFDYITSGCKKGETTHVNWDCVPYKKKLCPHIQSIWTDLKNELLMKGNPNITSKMMYFEKSAVVTKHGVESKRLKVQFQNLNVTAIMKFLVDLLPNTVFYRNHLHHYRHCYKELDEMFKRCASVDIDFSENLTVPVKFEPQSLNWCHQQVTVHSGILKCNGKKTTFLTFQIIVNMTSYLLMLLRT